MRSLEFRIFPGQLTVPMTGLPVNFGGIVPLGCVENMREILGANNGLDDVLNKMLKDSGNKLHWGVNSFFEENFPFGHYG